MASSVAHEFNNLMTVVLANLERLETEQDPTRRTRQVGRARWGAERATKLTDQMLSFARRQFHDNQVLDVNATIAGCDTILDQMAGSSSRVQPDLASESLLVSLDASQLEMALLNLVRNAADASTDGGAVIVSTRTRSRREDNGQVWIEVTVVDQGSGMDSEVVRRATEPFFTTKALGKGTGLGLSMVKGFVEQSGGAFEI
jgi:signal transduction histidine kinase